MLSDSPAKYITVSPISIESGIESVMIRVMRRRRRKKKSTPTAKRAPILPLLRSVARLSRITEPWSKKTSISISERRGSSFSSSVSSTTARLTSRVLASPSLNTCTATAGLPLTRTRYFLSGSA